MRHKLIIPILGGQWLHLLMGIVSIPSQGVKLISIMRSHIRKNKQVSRCIEPNYSHYIQNIQIRRSCENQDAHRYDTRSH